MQACCQADKVYEAAEQARFTEECFEQVAECLRKPSLYQCEMIQQLHEIHKQDKIDRWNILQHMIISTAIAFADTETLQYVLSTYDNPVVYKEWLQDATASNRLWLLEEQYAPVV